MTQGRSIKIFLSYSHKDEADKDRLVTHLTLMKRQGLIAPWDDRQILPAEEWEPSIQKYLDEAELILLLISADFLASDFCWDRELQRAMERHDRGDAKVVPVFIQPCDWKGAPFGKLQGVPKDAVPICDFKTPAHGFTEAAKTIRRLVEALQQQPQHTQATGHEGQTLAPHWSDQLRIYGSGFAGRESELQAEGPWVAEHGPSLLVLDGLEPLQYPPNHFEHGGLKDPGIRSLLMSLANAPAGLCLISSRHPSESI
jgi:hypothetical protein